MHGTTRLQSVTPPTSSRLSNTPPTSSRLSNTPPTSSRLSNTTPRRFHKEACAGFVLLIALALSGCLTTSAGDEIRSAASAQEERIAALEQGSVQSREELDAKVRELEDVIERATQVVTRNSADAGAQVEAMREQLARLEGVVEELRHKLDAASAEQVQYRADLETRIAAGGKPGAVKPVIDPSQIRQTRRATTRPARPPTKPTSTRRRARCSASSWSATRAMPRRATPSTGSARVTCRRTSPQRRSASCAR